MNMIEVKGLRVVAGAAPDAGVEIVKGVDFTVKKGEVLALIGESGSGKTTIALSLLGHARTGCSIAAARCGSARWKCSRSTQRGRRALRARTVAYVAQSASAGFNPARTIMDQVTEPALLHKLMTPAAAREKAVALFRALALPVAGDDRRALSASGVGRAVAAPDGGDGADHRSGRRRVRRADDRARRHHADRSARGVQEGDPRTRHDGRVRVARSRGGRADGGPHRRAERRRRARERHDGAGARCARRCVHAPVARGDAPSGTGARAGAKQEARAAAARNPRLERGLWPHRPQRRAGRARARRREPARSRAAARSA